MSDRAATVELKAGLASCGIAPELGCAVTHFRTLEGNRAVDWFRPSAHGAHSAVPSASSGCFPLVPYSGRIADGILHWRGSAYQLPTGLLGDPHALHGTGWVSAWDVLSVTSDRASFSHAYEGPAWPFPFKAWLEFRLAEDLLTVFIAIDNTGQVEMPVGLGLHPIFAGHGIRLQANAARVWTIDDRKLFSGLEPVSAPWDFRSGAPLEGTALEHGFSDWDGRFELSWPDRGRRLAVAASEPLRHLVVYSRAYDETTDGFVCVEPVSHSVDAFNLSERGIDGTGTRTLLPGDRLSAQVEFRIV